MQTDVLIAGAGLSGLTLCRDLCERGVDCRLAEARERVGGRIISIQSSHDESGTTPADMGPSWIWPGQARIAALLDELGIGVFEQYSAGCLVYEDEQGRVRRDLDYSTMAGALRVAGGLAGLPRALAASLPAERLRLGHRVSRIRQTDRGYDVELVHARGQLRISANKVVLALPPRVALARIDFEALLSDDVIRQLSALPTWMAGHAKVFALYASPFWRDAGLSGDGISRRGPLMEIHDASGASPGRGALFGFVGLPADSPARAAAALVPDSLRQLQRMFGDAAAQPLDVIVRDWSGDANTATAADAGNSQHPHYLGSSQIEALAQQGLYFASSEMAPRSGGLIEGALEASASLLERL